MICSIPIASQRAFGLYWARIEGNRVFGDIDTANLYVARVCEISFFLSENCNEFCTSLNFPYPEKSVKTSARVSADMERK